MESPDLGLNREIFPENSSQFGSGMNDIELGPDSGTLADPFNHPGPESDPRLLGFNQSNSQNLQADESDPETLSAAMHNLPHILSSPITGDPGSGGYENLNSPSSLPSEIPPGSPTASRASAAASSASPSRFRTPASKIAKYDEVTRVSTDANIPIPLLRLWFSEVKVQDTRLPPPPLPTEKLRVQVHLVANGDLLYDSNVELNANSPTISPDVFKEIRQKANDYCDSLDVFQWEYISNTDKGTINIRPFCKNCAPTAKQPKIPLPQGMAYVQGLEARLTINRNGADMQTVYAQHVVLGMNLIVKALPKHEVPTSLNSFLFLNKSNHSSPPCSNCNSQELAHKAGEPWKNALLSLTLPSKKRQADPLSDADYFKTPRTQPQRSISGYSDDVSSPSPDYNTFASSSSPPISSSDSMQIDPQPAAPECGSQPRIDLIPCRVPAPSTSRVLGSHFRTLVQQWRDKVLNILASHASGASSPIPTVVLVVHGLAGTGKSTFARSLATSDLELPNNRFSLKMELPCEDDATRDSVIEQLRAQQGSTIPAPSSCEWLRVWLSTLSNFQGVSGGWLLVADNVNELKSVRPFIPAASVSGGCVIITSRTCPSANEAGWHPVPLSDWSNNPEDSVEMIRELLQLQNVSIPLLTQIADAVGHLPLALQHIASSIDHEDVESTLRQLLKHSLAIKLAKLSSPDQPNVIASMQVSFDRLSTKWQQQEINFRQYGIDNDNDYGKLLGNIPPLLMLRIGAYLGSSSQGDLLQRLFARLVGYTRHERQVRRNVPWTANEQDELVATRCRKSLADVSLVRLSVVSGEGGKSFSTLNIHRLVQEVVRFQFERPHSEESSSPMFDPRRWLILLAHTLYDAYAATRDSSSLTPEAQRAQNEPMLSHMIQLHRHLVTATLGETEVAALLQFASGQIRQFHQSDVSSALEPLENAYKILEKLVPSTSSEQNTEECKRLELELARVGSALGNALRTAKDFVRARGILQRAVATQMRLQPNHWELANVQVGLGKLLLKPNRFAEEDPLTLCKVAEFNLSKAVECFKKLNHARLNWAQKTLGECLKEKANYLSDGEIQIKQELETKAEELLEQAQEKCDPRFEPRILFEKAELCYQQNQAAKGLELCGKVRASYNNSKLPENYKGFQELDELENKFKGMMM